MRFWPVIAFIANLAVIWIAWTIRQVAEDRMRQLGEAIHRRIDEQAHRLTRLEVGAETTPRPGDVSKLEVRLTTIDGHVNTLSESVRGVRDSQDTLRSAVQRIEDYLLRKSG